MKNKGKTADIVNDGISPTKVKHLKVATSIILDNVKAKMLIEHEEKLTWDELIIDMAREYSKVKKLSIDFAPVD